MFSPCHSFLMTSRLRPVVWVVDRRGGRPSDWLHLARRLREGDHGHPGLERGVRGGETRWWQGGFTGPTLRPASSEHFNSSLKTCFGFLPRQCSVYSGCVHV